MVSLPPALTTDSVAIVLLWGLFVAKTICALFLRARPVAIQFGSLGDDNTTASRSPIHRLVISTLCLAPVFKSR